MKAWIRYGRGRVELTVPEGARVIQTPPVRPVKDPTRQIICLSYGQDLADKHAVDFRAVMNSGWYQSAFPKSRLRSKAIDDLVYIFKRFQFYAWYLIQTVVA